MNASMLIQFSTMSFIKSIYTEIKSFFFMSLWDNNDLFTYETSDTQLAWMCGPGLAEWGVWVDSDYL